MKKLGVIFAFLCIYSCTQKKEPAVKISISKEHGITTASGSIHRIDSFPSKHIVPRPVDIWMPDGYSPKKKYAVLYMHDGQMLFDSLITWNKQEWQVDEWASKLQNEEKTKDFIVVAPHNIAEIRHSDYFPKKPFELLSQKQQDSIFSEAKKHNLSLTRLNSDDYLKFLVTELKPFIDSNYSVFTDTNNTFVAGSSMGGLISMYAVSEYPNVFGGAACLSTHWIGTFTNENNPIPEAFFTYMDANLPNASTHRIYFDYGTATLDAMYLKYQDKVSEVIGKKGHQINRKFEGADHSENSWNKRLDIPFVFLLGKE
jgi:enterochelin esterase-like enzyme